MTDPFSRRGIVGVAAVLFGGGGKAVQAQAVEALKAKLLPDFLQDDGAPPSRGPPPQTANGLGAVQFNPIQFAARLAAGQAQKRANLHRRHLQSLRSMSSASRAYYATKANQEARGLWRKLDVVMGYRPAEELLGADPDDYG